MTTQSGFDAGSYTPDQEPGLAQQPTDFRDREHPDAVDANRQAEIGRYQRAIASTPPWVAHKYVWRTPANNPNGRPYLVAREDYLAYINANVILFSQGMLQDINQAIVTAAVEEGQAFATTMEAINDREQRAFYGYAKDRATRNATYAITAQWEIEQWIMDQGRNGYKPDPQKLADKESRRDTSIEIASYWRAVCLSLMPEHEQLTDADYFKTIERVVRQDSGVEQGKILNPQQSLAQGTEQLDVATEVTVHRPSFMK